MREPTRAWYDVQVDELPLGRSSMRPAARLASRNGNPRADVSWR